MLSRTLCLSPRPRKAVDRLAGRREALRERRRPAPAKAPERARAAEKHTHASAQAHAAMPRKALRWRQTCTLLRHFRKLYRSLLCSAHHIEVRAEVQEAAGRHPSRRRCLPLLLCACGCARAAGRARRGLRPSGARRGSSTAELCSPAKAPRCEPDHPAASFSLIPSDRCRTAQLRMQMATKFAS